MFAYNDLIQSNKFVLDYKNETTNSMSPTYHKNKYKTKYDKLFKKYKNLKIKCIAERKKQDKISSNNILIKKHKYDSLPEWEIIDSDGYRLRYGKDWKKVLDNMLSKKYGSEWKKIRVYKLRKKYGKNWLKNVQKIQKTIAKIYM